MTDVRSTINFMFSITERIFGIPTNEQIKKGNNDLWNCDSLWRYMKKLDQVCSSFSGYNFERIDWYKVDKIDQIW